MEIMDKRSIDHSIPEFFFCSFIHYFTPRFNSFMTEGSIT